MTSSQLLAPANAAHAAHAAGGTAADLRLRRPGPPAPVRPTPAQRAVIEHAGRRLRVLAGPGTGKTATLVEAVAQRITDRGVSPGQILVLTFSRRAAAELTSRITRRLGITTREPLVRTLHGYAFGLLRRQAARSGDTLPRLLAAGESDHVVRELLAGHRDDGGGGWPTALRPALGSPTFAAELRDLLLRTAERGIGPGRLAELGRRRRRPEWQAAARFAREYQDVADLRQGTAGLGPALDQAELTRAALALLTDDEVLADEQARLRRLFVDEYQDVDPAQARLIERLASGADEFVVVGDPDQSIYAFRGSQPGAMRAVQVDATVALTVSHRLAPTLLTATRRVAGALPGGWPHRELVTADPDPDPEADHPPAARPTGDLLVRTLPTAASEAAFIADELRRAHLQAGVPWSRMAVLVRSPAADLPIVRRGLAAAGVPCAGGPVDPGADDPVVRAIITLLRCGLDPARLTGEQAVELMAAPGICMDGDALRRLRRRLRAAHPVTAGPTADLVAAALLGAPMPDDLPDDLRDPVLAVRSLLATVSAAADDPDPRVPLWRVWQRLGLAEDLLAASLRGGRAGQRADRTLDAVLGLFDAAGELAERLPYAGVRAFLAEATDRRIATDAAADRGHGGQGVALLSAHAAKGLEWDVVCLPGVSEGRWPVVRRTQSLLGLDELLDAEDGIAAGGAARGAEVLNEERRLFYVATTRARRRLVATSVSDQDTLPSRFLTELAGSTELPHGWPEQGDGLPRRSLLLAHLVADLRRAVTDPAVPEPTATAAARQLARLAAAGVDGAHPRDWYGLSGLSSAAPPVEAGAAVTLSPSTVESLIRCPLRAVLERRGARSGGSQQQIEGIVMHALVDGLARGVSRADLVAETERFLAGQTNLPPWLVARTRRSLEAMLTAARTWMAELPDGRRSVATEAQLSAWLPRTDLGSTGAPCAAEDGASREGSSEAGPSATAAGPPDALDRRDGTFRPVKVNGRADRVDRAPDGSLIIVDFKTGATVPSRAAVEQNAQLAVYQLVLRLGAGRSLIADGDADRDGDAGPPGGAELVYLRSGAPTVRHQPPLDDADAQAWVQELRAAAEWLAAPTSVALENRSCERCPVRSSCPLQPSGRQVTR
ncbi:MAG TPA: ATP-dependent DNA helicase [Nakamurella sp.]